MDIDAFVDACLANDDELLKQFWKKGMSTSRDEENNLIMTNFCKVFVAFLIRKPHKVSDAPGYPMRKPLMRVMLIRMSGVYIHPEAG